MRRVLFCLLATGLTLLSPARAGEPEAQFGWGLEFGGTLTRVQPTMRLGLATGGVALFERTYRTNASEAPAADQTGEPDAGSSWVPWTVGGIVAVVAIGANLADDQAGGCVGCIDDEENGTQISGVEDGGVGCANGTCVTCPDGTVVSDCDALVARLLLRGEPDVDVEHQRWLDSGTGHMGDLFH